VNVSARTLQQWRADTKEVEPISVYRLFLDLDARLFKFDVQSAGEEGPIALELYATFDL